MTHELERTLLVLQIQALAAVEKLLERGHTGSQRADLASDAVWSLGTAIRATEPASDIPPLFFVCQAVARAFL